MFKYQDSSSKQKTTMFKFGLIAIITGFLALFYPHLCPKSLKKSVGIETLNDVFFNKYTVELLDNRAKEIIKAIDQSIMLGKYTIQSRFNETVLNIDKLSTGCKTVLNIIYNPQKIFDIRECGENALDLIYRLPAGNIYCDYPLISFDMEAIEVCDKYGRRVISSYEELKEWWANEN